MRYTVWSRGRLVAHTDLDIPTVRPNMRQGFLEPTAEGAPLLADATSVWRAIAEVKRDRRARGEPSEHDHSLVEAAVERAHDLHLMLRDESGDALEFEYIRVTDLFDLENGNLDDMSDTEEEQEAELQIWLSSLPESQQQIELAKRATMLAEVEEMVKEVLAERGAERRFGSAWPVPAAEDPRWDTMQYLAQVHLKGDRQGEPDL